MLNQVARITKTIRGCPVHVELTNIIKDKNFKNSTPVIKFTLSVFLDDMKLIQAPDFMLIDGRIQFPSKSFRIPGGEAKMKVLIPLHPLLSLIHECIEKSDWWDQFPTLPPLLPIAPKMRGDEDEFNREQFGVA